MKYWIFDLDGTLVDSFQPYFEAVEKLMNKTLTLEERKVGVSLHASEFFKLHLNEEKAKEALMQLKQQNIQDLGNLPKFAAIEELFIYLKEKDCHISIFTSRDLTSATHTLKKNGLDKFIDHLVSGDCVSEKKPNPEGLHKLLGLYNCKLEDMVMIGDHDCDVEAGANAGVFSVRASWHPHWPHDPCTVASQQFHSVETFLSWIKQTVN
jgi:HAD superfamily hydrolase (TIGR01549 family)